MTRADKTRMNTKSTKNNMKFLTSQQNDISRNPSFQFIFNIYISDHNPAKMFRGNTVLYNQVIVEENESPINDDNSPCMIPMKIFQFCNVNINIVNMLLNPKPVYKHQNDSGKQVKLEDETPELQQADLQVRGYHSSSDFIRSKKLRSDTIISKGMLWVIKYLLIWTIL